MKNNFAYGLMASMLFSLSVHAGTMGDIQAYPSGFLMGGDVGFGYLST